MLLKNSFLELRRFQRELMVMRIVIQLNSKLNWIRNILSFVGFEDRICHWLDSVAVDWTRLDDLGHVDLRLACRFVLS